MIEFEGVTKVFPGGTVAVDDVSLVAPAGRITVVMGPRGCGKTSLLRMVNRMLDPSAGRVLVNGASNTNLRRSQLRRGIGYLASGGLFPHRTVARNVETVPLLVGSNREQARQRAMALLEHVGLPTSFADKYPGQLSAGQQVRVGLARALAADPPVLLLDAPFLALEPAVRQDIQDDLLELQRIAPKTIFLATEDIDEAIKLGDQIAVLDSGRLVQLATPQVLLSYPGSDFVADLLGRDRGIRKLTFLPASDLTLTPAATVQAGTTGSRAQAIADSHRERWLLVLDPDRRPRGWVDSAALGPDQIVSGPVVHPLGGTFYPDESVLAALDAAILSPPGLAVCLDDAGRPLGVASHTDIAKYLAAQPPISLVPPAPEPAPREAAPLSELRPARPAGEEARSALAPEPAAAKADDETVVRPAVSTRSPAAPAAAPRPEPVPAASEPAWERARTEDRPAASTPVSPEPAWWARTEDRPVAPAPASAAPVKRPPAPQPVPVVKETSRPIAAVAVPASVSTLRPAAQAPAVQTPAVQTPAAQASGGQTTPVQIRPSAAPVQVTNGGRTGAVPAPTEPERSAPERSDPVVESGAARASAATRSDAAPGTSTGGGWEWRSDLGQWVQVEPDAAGATAGDGSGR